MAVMKKIIVDRVNLSYYVSKLFDGKKGQAACPTKSKFAARGQ